MSSGAAIVPLTIALRGISCVASIFLSMICWPSIPCGMSCAATSTETVSESERTLLL